MRDGLGGVRRVDGHVEVGAAATISELLREPLVAQTAPALVQAAAAFANPLVRNRATLGGNLADASPAADTAPPLLALDAVVDLASAAGTRCLPLKDFLTGVRETLRRPDELLVAVRWPIPVRGSAGAFHKIGLRKSDAISVLSVAVHLALDEAGVCREARIALGAVAPRPVRAYTAEAALVGQVLTLAHLAEAACLAGDDSAPHQRYPGLRGLPPAGHRDDHASAADQDAGGGRVASARRSSMKPQIVTLYVNGRTHQAALAPNVTLLQALRDLGYVDVKSGCEKGDCGASAVLLDGSAVNSCLVLACQADGCQIVTAAGLGTAQRPHPLQTAFADHGGYNVATAPPA